MENDPLVAELARSLVVTPVIGSTRSMRWTSPVTGACCTLFETGVFTVSRRTDEGKEVVTTGSLTAGQTDGFLHSPQGLDARVAAARAITAVDCTVQTAAGDDALSVAS